MTTISNSYSSTQTAGSTKPATDPKTEEKEESLWDSFFNEVIAPSIEDAACSYLDENYGTNLAEQKAQKELEATYEEALAKEEAKDNRSLEDITNDMLGDILSDGFNYYCDNNFNTNLAEQKEQRKQEEDKLLQEAKEYKAEQEAQTPESSFLVDLLKLLFAPKN